MKLSIIAMILLTACTASSNTRPAEPWRIEIATSGGFAGKGTGTFAIASDGKITIISTSGKTCTFDATDAERQRFTSLLANAKPGSWQASYKPENPCCDRFEYVMTIDEAGAQRKVDWVDDPAPMPADLAAITAAMTSGADSIRAQYGARCH